MEAASTKQTAKRLTQSSLHALREGLTSIYWFKPDLESFVRATVPCAEILTRINFNEPKRRVANEVVALLSADQDKYLGVLLDLMAEVAAFEDFNHLARLEDGALKVAQAQRAVANLRRHYDGHAAIRAEREAAAEHRQRARSAAERAQADREELDQLRTRASALLAEQAQKRGYALERLLRDLFELFDLDPKAAFAINGEQIDGAFTFDGIDYLVEARWQGPPVQPRDLDSFDAKIRRKLDNTLGLFVAMNGFTDAAVAIHSQSRPTMILMDGADLWAVLEGRIALTEALRRKRRHAAQTGDIFLRIAEL